MTFEQAVTASQLPFYKLENKTYLLVERAYHLNEQIGSCVSIL